MSKGKLLAVLIGFMIAASALALFAIPVQLVVDVDPIKASDFQTITKEDVKVYPSPLLTRGRMTKDFKFAKESGDGYDDLLITSGLLQKRIHMRDLSVKSLSATYMGTVKEGDVISPERINAVVSFENGQTETLSDIEIYSASGKVSRAETVAIGTRYGMTTLRFTYPQITQIKASYKDTAYAGYAFSEDNVEAYLIYEDGAMDKIDVLSCEGGKYFTGKCAYTTYTPYGKTMLEITPVAISYAESSGDWYAGDVFEGPITLTYDDGKTLEIESGDVEFSASTELVEGANRLPFTFHGANGALYLNAKATNGVVNIRRNSAREIDLSSYNTISDSLFVTIRSVGSDLPYMVTHIAISDPNQLGIADANGQYASGLETLSSAAQRSNWVVSVNGGFFDTSTGASLSECIIRNGQIISGGITNGTEICITTGGALYSPPAGISAEDLLAANVRDVITTKDPLLIQDGVLTVEGSIDLTGLSPRTAIGMVRPGEYYLVSAIGTGLTYSHLQSIFSSLNCTYARPLDGGSSVSLYFGSIPVLTDSDRAVGNFLFFREVLSIPPAP